ncbi:HEAT repeat domain-containing protein [Haloarcula salinisoli]|uniref:HEAT repeat domain-containing protein n=1 Tax=Haloarcula salinisoli TaxID=2487746 RepID=A0A8J8C9A9_9EURY|nr:HEAT repeat domain-containing protein [Halomicroarcula salinisoli]MBX0305142.1 HEAT repeat domain-containing protein [Halomicroarcula salinisoli]
MGLDQILEIHRDEPIDAGFVRTLLDTVRDLPALSVTNRADVIETITANDRWQVSVDIQPRNSQEILDSLGTTLANVIHHEYRPEVEKHTFGFWLGRSSKPRLILDRLAHVAPLFDALGCEYGHATPNHARPPLWVGPETWRRSSIASLFGPSLVDRIGRDRLFELPALAVREYENGSVVVVAPASYRDATMTLSERDHSGPYATGRLPDPPLSFDGTAPNEWFEALSGLDGWTPRQDSGRRLLRRSATHYEEKRAYIVTRLADDVPRVRASAIRTLDREDVLSMDHLDRLPVRGDPFRHEEPAARAELLRSSLSVPDEGDDFAAVRTALTADDHRVRYAATSRLDDASSRAVARDLTVRVRDDPRPRVRARALDSLAPTNGDYEFRTEVSTVLGRCFGREESERVLVAVMDAAGRVGAVDLFADGLTHDGADVRAAAAQALRETPYPCSSQFEALYPLLGHRDTSVALAVAKALSAAIWPEPEEAVPVLVDALATGSTPAVRAGAAWALERGGAFSRERVRMGLTDPSERVRVAAIEALQDNPEMAAQYAGYLLDRLMAATAKRELDAVGEALRVAWADCGDSFPAEATRLHSLFGAPSPARRRAAATAVSGGPAGPELLRDVVDKWESPQTVGAALAGLGASVAVADRRYFEAHLSNRNPYVRSSALTGVASVIATHPDQELTDTVKTSLREALREQDPRLARAGLRAADLLGEPREVWDALLCDSLSKGAKLRLVDGITTDTLAGVFDRAHRGLYHITDREVFDAFAEKYHRHQEDRPLAGPPW